MSAGGWNWSRDPRLCRAAGASGQAAPPPPIDTVFGPTRASEREQAYGVRYERGEGMIIDRPAPPPASKPRSMPDSAIICIDQFVSIEHQWDEAGLLMWKKERDVWEAETNVLTDHMHVVLPAARFTRAALAPNSGRFMLMSGEEPSYTDAMFRLQNNERSNVYSFRVKVDGRYLAVNRFTPSEDEMDELLRKLIQAIEQHRARNPHPTPQIPEDQMIFDLPTVESNETTPETPSVDEQMLIDPTTPTEPTEAGTELGFANKPHLSPLTQPSPLPTPTEEINSQQNEDIPNSSNNLVSSSNNLTTISEAVSPRPSDSSHTYTTPPTRPQSPRAGQSKHQSEEDETPTAGSHAQQTSPSPSGEPTRDGEEMEPIKEGDLVIRLRPKTRYDDPELRVNSYDVWDGPWRVEKFAGATATAKANEAKGKRTRSTQPLKAPETAKLLFPYGSKAAAWTSVKELRKAFELPTGSSPVEYTKSRSAQRQIYAAAVAASKDPERERSSSPLFVARLLNGTFVSFPHVSAKGTEDDMYEIGHLRAKRVLLHSVKNYTDERVEDAETQQWARENKVKKGMVPVVEYRVHWAGWASEDDTWERAQDNIPEATIKIFEGVREQPTVFPHTKN